MKWRLIHNMNYASKSDWVHMQCACVTAAVRASAQVHVDYHPNWPLANACNYPHKVSSYRYASVLDISYIINTTIKSP